MRRLLFILLIVGAPSQAWAIRWTLGVASELTPVVVDPGTTADGTPVRLAFRPVVELEPARWISVGAYAPFTVYRTGEGTGGAASSGAESVFGLSLAFRYPWIRKDSPEEVLFYVRGRGGFATVSGNAGPFAGGSIGSSITWLDTGRGLFFDINVGWLSVSDVPVGLVRRDVERVTVGLTIGLVFRLGGEAWQVSGRTSL